MSNLSDIDRENIKFFLSADRATMNEWYDKATPEDMAYATDLLQRYNTELTLRELDLIDEENGDNVTYALRLVRIIKERL